jgi:hypothetical protein
MTYKLSNGNLLLSVSETSPCGLVEACVQIEPRSREYKEFAREAIPMSYEDEVVFRLLYGLPCRAVTRQ